MALLTIDEYRIEARRDGLCCWILHPTQSEKSRLCSNQTTFFDVVAKVLVKGPMKTLVGAITIALLIVGAYGMNQLKMEFRPEWLMDPAAEGRVLQIYLTS